MQIGGKRKSQGSNKTVVSPRGGSGASGRAGSGGGWSQMMMSSAANPGAGATSQNHVPRPPARIVYSPPSKIVNHFVLHPDCVVHLRDALDLETQQFVYDTAMCLGDEASEGGGKGPGSDLESTGFYRARENGRLQLNMGNRGRVIVNHVQFPDGWADLCLRLLKQAQAVCPSLKQQCPEYNPTTCVVNFYNEKAEFKWHRDSEDPERVRNRTQRPIVSISVGDACEFGFKESYDDPEHSSVRLNSGDVLVFGGRMRTMPHSVLRILPKTCPTGVRMAAQGRLNLTFRDVVGVEDVEAFPRYRVRYSDIEPVDTS